jgi:RNA polymerase sigma-70 factor (ECF subfamily)
MNELVAAFLEHRPLPGKPSAKLSATLAELEAQGRASWPRVTLTPAQLGRRLAARVTTGDPAGAIAQLETLRGHAAELYLAAACAEGVPAAVAEFTVRYLGPLPRYLARMKPDAAFVDEVRQRLSVKLLVATPDAPPRIGEYAGRGPLASWVRVAALHLAISLRRADKRGRIEDDEEVDEHGSPAPDPEVELLARRYRPAFEGALREALTRLDPAEREVLRLYYIDGMTVDTLGEHLRVGRSTAARRVAAARRAAFEQTRVILRERLQLGSSAFDSIARQLKSQLTISLSTLFSRES